jgi:ATP synthase protein I
LGHWDSRARGAIVCRNAAAAPRYGGASCRNGAHPVGEAEGGRRAKAAASRGGSVEEDKKKFIRQLFLLSSTGLSMVLAIFIGLAFGVFLDNKLGTHPWLTLIFLGLGIIAGFRNIFWFIKHYGISDDKKDEKRDRPDD